MTVAPGALPDKSEIEKQQEWRLDVRYPFTATAEIMDLRSNTRVTGRSSDLGLGGCYIDILSPFTVGSLVRAPGLEEGLQAMATVTYAQQSFGMGLALRRSSEHQIVLQSYRRIDWRGAPELMRQLPIRFAISPSSFAAGSE